MTARHRLGGGSYAPALLLDRRSGHVADMTASGVIQQSGGGSLAREALDRKSRESCSASASSISPGNSLSPATRGNRAPRDDCFRDLDGLGADDSS